MVQFLSRNTQVRKLLEGRASTDMLQMLMKRELDFSDEEYLECFTFALTYDDLRGDAHMRLQEIPEAIKVKYAGRRDANLHVLEYITQEGLQENNGPILFALVSSKWTPEELLVKIAGKGPASVLEAMAENPLPLVATPEIMEWMKKNSACTNLIRDKLESIHHLFFEDAAPSPPPPPPEPEAFKPEPVAPAPAAAAAAGAAAAATPSSAAGADAAAAAASASGGLSSIAVQSERLTMFQKVTLMSVAEKIRLAFKGGKAERMVLIKDPNRLVLQSVIDSPKLTDDEVINLINDRSIPGEIIQKIAENREWTRNYAVVMALVQNPKVPVSRATAFIKQLHERDLKALVLDKNISPVVRELAANYYKTRHNK